jgi:hypothetical protein
MPHLASRDTALQRPVRYASESGPLHTWAVQNHLANFTIPNRTIRTDSSKSAKMPSEVSDIKQFIEICRRKDASCTFFNFPRLGLDEEGDSAVLRLETHA